MTSQSLLRALALSLCAVSLAACTAIQGPGAKPDDQPSPPAAVEPVAIPAQPPVPPDMPADTPAAPPPASTNAAVVALLDTAHADAGAGRLPSAAASLERALRIEPRNPHLWHELAKLELEKGDYRKAENLAAKSNSWAVSNKPLQARNWRLIAEAKGMRGDSEGAKAALARAKSLE